MSAPSRSGFALLEVVLALGLIGIGVLALIGSAPAALRLELRAAVWTRLTLAGASVLDSLDAIARTDCGALAAAGAVDSGPPVIDVRWQVAHAGATATLEVTSRAGVGTVVLADTLRRVVVCG